MRKSLCIAVLITVLLFISVPGYSYDLFATYVDYAVGEYPVSITTGDFNGDEKADIATANTNSHSVSILIGSGDGTFQPKRDFAVEGEPSFIATGDFNGDGKVDLVTANYNSISLFLGNGDGTFQINTTIDETGWYPIIVKIGDFNGDGKTDLSTANAGVGTVSVLIGNGDGTFQSRSDHGVGIHLRAMTTGDFNGDGKPDIAAAYSYTGWWEGRISILIGNGDGTFQSYGDYSLMVADCIGEQCFYDIILTPGSMATADFNGDGDTDLVVIPSQYSPSPIHMFIGNGDGTFQYEKGYRQAGSGWAYAFFATTGDFNGDGRIDLIVAQPDDDAYYNRYNGSVSMFTGNNDGTFRLVGTSTVVVGGHSVSLAIADFNGDGLVDVASANLVRNTVSILLKNPNSASLANAGPDQVIECAGPSGSSVTLDGSASSDPDGDILTYTWTWDGGSVEGVKPTVSLPLGTTVVTLTISDGKATASDTVSITVKDTTPPVTSVTGSNGSWQNTGVISAFSVSDSCSGVKEIYYSVDGSGTTVSGDSASVAISTEGIHNITYYAMDNAGNIESPKTITVKIDKTPAALNISASPNILWPPNHKMVDVLVGGNAIDTASGIASVAFTVTDEYGQVRPTISGFNTSIQLEAWREEADKDGRRYTITATAIDAAGNKSIASTTVLVPHDQGGN